MFKTKFYPEPNVANLSNLARIGVGWDQCGHILLGSAPLAPTFSVSFMKTPRVWNSAARRSTSWQRRARRLCRDGNAEMLSLTRAAIWNSPRLPPSPARGPGTNRVLYGTRWADGASLYPLS